MPSPPSSPSAQPPAEQPPSNQEKGQQQAEQDKQKAAHSLKKAGQQVAQSAQQLPSPTSPQQSQNGEWDPLIPKSDQSSESQSDIFEESEAAAPSTSTDSTADNSSEAQASAESSDTASADGDASTEPDDMMMPEESGGPASQSDEQTMADAGAEGDQMSDERSDDLSNDIMAAQKALEEAGIALQTAGEALETAASDEELEEAEAALSKARLSVIIAGQDLMDIKDIFSDTPNEAIFGEAEDALNEANIAIVVATDSIFSAKIELPDFSMPGGLPSIPGAPGSTGPANGSGTQGGSGIPNSGMPGDGFPRGGTLGSGRGSELDKELNESIAIFEGRILDARNDVMGSTPPPTAGDNVPGVAVLGGTGTNDGQGQGTFEENDPRLEDGVPDVIQQGNMPEGADVASIESGTLQSAIPDDIPDPQGDDIVAQQLREAAISETNADLKAKLWEEYKKYKAGL